jgi:hypothetical protein
MPGHHVNDIAGSVVVGRAAQEEQQHVLGHMDLRHKDSELADARRM